jgi:hypothetical protein
MAKFCCFGSGVSLIFDHLLLYCFVHLLLVFSDFFWEAVYTEYFSNFVNYKFIITLRQVIWLGENIIY